MVYQANVVSVMIASPGDVMKERELVRGIIHETNDLHAANNKTVLLPVGWETHAAPELAGRAQEMINKNILDKCDLLVGIFWTRLGTPTGEAESGTVEEIKRHVDAGKPAMIYFSSVPVAPGSYDVDQWEALLAFRDWCKGKGLIEFYDDTSGFIEKFRRQLQIILRDSDYLTAQLSTAWSQSADSPETLTTVTLLDEAATLLIEAAKGDGEIMQFDSVGGKLIQANNTDFCDTWERRKVAKWEAGLAQLEELGLIADQGYKREVFGLTAKGFQVADEAIGKQDSE